MKKCPNCQQIYSDDNQFCLNDGTPLSAVPDALPTLPFFQPSDSTPTQFFVPPKTVVANAPADSSRWLFLIIGVMATALIAMGIAFFVSRGSSERETAKTETPVKSNENTANANQPNVENKTSETPSNVNKTNPTAFTLPRPLPSINPNLDPAGRWAGDWTSSKAYWTAILDLRGTGGGKYTGEIYWTLHRHSNPNKSGKSGATATEFVQGTFNPATRTVLLSGYRKTDPQNIAVLDRYNLTLAENNQTLSGGSKSNGLFNLRR